MEITLNILAEDIWKDNYFSVKNCPITLAYARAGHPELIDQGNNNGMYKYTDEHRALLHAKLFGMYNTLDPKVCYTFTIGSKSVCAPAIPIEDFEVTLVFDEDTEQ